MSLPTRNTSFDLGQDSREIHALGQFRQRLHGLRPLYVGLKHRRGPRWVHGYLVLGDVGRTQPLPDGAKRSLHPCGTRHRELACPRRGCDGHGRDGVREERMFSPTEFGLRNLRLRSSSLRPQVQWEASSVRPSTSPRPIRRSTRQEASPRGFKPLPRGRGGLVMRRTTGPRRSCVRLPRKT